MKKLKILDISDMQNGFTREDGNLYVKGAQEIIAPANRFLRRVRNGIFDHTLIVLDTHFSEEYHRTEECTMFPLHCEYGTRDWEPSIDVSGLPDIRYLMKNQFNMWGRRRFDDIRFSDPKRGTAFDNLFHFVDDPHEPTEKAARDEFINTICRDRDTADIEVTILGVASDYCNRYAMEGWLGLGASVTIIHDLTKGIEKETLQVLEECTYRQYGSGRLRSIDSAGYLRELGVS